MYEYQVFKKNEQGVSAISFAIIAPVLIFLIISVLQLGIMMVIQNALEAAARQASRYALVGTPNSSVSRTVAINNKINSTVAAYSAGIVNTNNLIITATAYSNFTNTASGTAGYGAGNQGVQYTISYVYNTLYPIFPTLGNLVTLKATAYVENENF